MVGKLWIGCLAIALSLTKVDALAVTETVDGIEWTYSVSAGEVSLGDGYSSAIPSSTSGTITIPSSLGGKPVTSIGSCAFFGCSGLTSVTIPDSVTSIGDWAFHGCDGLKSVTIPDSVTSIGAGAFFWCSGLTSVTIPDSVTSIGPAAFERCSGLTSIPDSVTNIEDRAFKDCDGLTSVTIPDGVKSIGESAFEDCRGLMSVTIGNGVTSIGDGAFCGCHNLKSVRIPDACTNIGYCAFAYCYNLESARIPDACTSVGEMAFFLCVGLADAGGFVIVRDVLHCYSYPFPTNVYDVVIPAGVVKIGSSAFGNANGINTVLRSVTISDGVTSIGSSAFNHCWCLTSVVIPDSVTSIGSSAFNDCRNLASLTIPSGVTSIGSGAFSYCNGSLFDTMSIPGVRIVDGWVVGATTSLSGDLNLTGVRGICDSAFQYCSGLTGVMVPDSVTIIGAGAFSHCRGLRSVTIPDSVTSIGDSAFEDCSELVNVYVSVGDVERVKSLMTGSGFNVKGVSFIEVDEFVLMRVIFHASGGSLVETNRLVVSGCDVGELPTPMLAGHTFLGWFTSANGGSQVSASTVVTADAVYYAHWRTNSYTVTFNANGGMGGWSRSMDYGAAIIAPMVTRTGYTFAGWLPAVPSTVPAGDNTYVAQWTKNKYTVTFDANGGTGGWSKSMDYGAPIVAPATTRTGYTFSGWLPEDPSTVPAANATYVAQWTKNKYTVTFNANGGIGGWSESMDYGAAIVAPTVTRTGYTFAGWSPAVPSTVPADNVTYVAQWTKPSTPLPTPDPGPTDGGEHDRVQLWEGGPYWATTNIGAEEPYEYGYYFWWGDTVGYKRENNAWVATDGSAYNFQFYNNAISRQTYNKSTAILQGEGWIVSRDDSYVLAPEHDAAQVQWGGGWRMPTYQELDDLCYNKCDWTWGSMNGVSGYVVRGRGDYATNSIFFPCAGLGYIASLDSAGSCGYYWSSEPDSDRSWYLYFCSSYPGTCPDYRCYGRPVRPVQTPSTELNDVTVVFDANGGAVSPASRMVASGAAVGALPTPTRIGYAFDGWWTAASGGVQVTDATKVMVVVTYYAHWTKNSTPSPTPGPDPTPEPDPDCWIYSGEIDGAAPATAASEYNGYLVDAKGGVKGMIQVKVGKPNAKTGLAAIKASVAIGAAKKSLKAAGNGKAELSPDGPTEVELVGGEECVIVLGADGFAGSYGAYAIDGARNFFTSKDKAELNAANAVLGKWLGGISILADAGNFTVTISAKGKAKVSGTLANGKKATGNAVFLIGEEWACVPVALPKANISFALWLPLDGDEVVVSGLGDDVVAGRGGALKAGAAFRIDVDEFAAVTGIDALPYLPDGVSVEVKGAKWVVAGGAKAGKVMYLRGTQEIDESKLGENPSGLKLTYKKADGSFKGSFKAYADVKGKLKATTVSVSGIVLNGVGYGTATVKGKGSVPVTIE